MIRIVVFAVVLIALTLVGIFFADNPGKITIQWLDAHFETTVGVLLLLNLALVLGLAALILVLRGVIRLPGVFQRWSNRRHSRLGHKALTEAIIELEAGDARKGLKLARKVDGYLGDKALTSVLTAKAAEVEGADGAARREYEKMLKDPKSEFFGLRGLLSLALKEEDKSEALRLARRAHKLRPRTPWVIVTLFDLAIGEHNWQMALDALKDAGKAEALPADDIKKRRAVLLTAMGKEAIARNEPYEAARLLRQAIEAKSDHVAAWTEQARAQILLGKPKKAREMVEAVWRTHPTKAAGDLYLQTLDGSDIAKLTQVKKLAALNATDVESLTMVAEFAMKAGNSSLATESLEAALAENPGVRQYRLMAEFEEGKGNKDAARDWLLKASEANLDPGWTCSNCGTATDEWEATCPSCGAFGSLDWRRPLRFVHLTADEAEKPADAA